MHSKCQNVVNYFRLVLLKIYPEIWKSRPIWSHCTTVTPIFNTNTPLQARKILQNNKSGILGKNYETANFPRSVFGNVILYHEYYYIISRKWINDVTWPCNCDFITHRLSLINLSMCLPACLCVCVCVGVGVWVWVCGCVCVCVVATKEEYKIILFLSHRCMTIIEIMERDCGTLVEGCFLLNPEVHGSCSRYSLFPRIIEIFFRKWPTPASFIVYFRSFQTNIITNFTKN